MSDTYEVISAFLDDEPFEAARLTEALSEPGGRELLIDLLALRHLAQAELKDTPALQVEKPKRFALHALAAAAVFVAMVGGYLAGVQRSDMTMPVAPPATRIVQAPAAWQEVPPGRLP